MESYAWKFFSSIENKNVQVPAFFEPKPFTKENLGYLYKVEPVMNENKISFFIPIDYVEKKHDTWPADYISHCIGHEGKGSLLSALIAKDLAISLSSYQDNMLNSLSYLMISVTLTDKGLKDYEEVVKMTYAYVNMLKEVGP